ncbi:unnamed protein product [Soboliphyme baturini]|uniref:Uncharacterized protein n=1 Tax=Soboliphyme baturini TaxID=241478 RepID=A0A183IQI1_9BILA|nr:unnamed protein product [Soboliphyme baturini]
MQNAREVRGARRRRHMLVVTKTLSKNTKMASPNQHTRNGRNFDANSRRVMLNVQHQRTSVGKTGCENGQKTGYRRTMFLL